MIFLEIGNPPSDISYFVQYRLNINMERKSTICCGENEEQCGIVVFYGTCLSSQGDKKSKKSSVMHTFENEFN